jgi:hypothetical protein
MLNNAFSFNWIEKTLLPKSTMLRPSPIINTVVEGHRLTMSTIVEVIRLPSHFTAQAPGILAHRFLPFRRRRTSQIDSYNLAS